MLNWQDKVSGLAWGSFIGDALAMPVHWYYDRSALARDYGEVRAYLAPKNPHPGSILWRSKYAPLNERGDILHEQAQYWGKPGIHYHQFLRAGENTLNLQLAKVLIETLIANGDYDADDYLERYVDFMLSPGKHRDTYVEECHRKFFTAYARGIAPRKCGGNDIHIGGLAHVGVLCAFFGSDFAACQAAVREHVSLTHPAPEVLASATVMTQIVRSVLGGDELRQAIIEHAPDWFSRKKADRWSRDIDTVVIGERVSPACYIADAFPASLYLAWKYSADFESGIVANTNVGGDNCHRGAVVGALLGAAVGRSKIPTRFTDDLHEGEALGAQIQNMLAIRTKSLGASPV